MPEHASQSQTRTSLTRFTSAGGTVMQHRTLGRTAVQVSTLVLGAMKPGRVSGDGRQGHRRSPRRHRAGYEDEHANGRRAQPSGQFARARKVADEAGLTMIQLTLGFVTAHPAVTSAIIGAHYGPLALSARRRRHRACRRRARRGRRGRRDRRSDVDLAANEKNDAPPALLDAAQRRRCSLVTSATRQQAGTGLRTPAG